MDLAARARPLVVWRIVVATARAFVNGCGALRAAVWIAPHQTRTYLRQYKRVSLRRAQTRRGAALRRQSRERDGVAEQIQARRGASSAGAPRFGVLQRDVRRRGMVRRRAAANAHHRGAAYAAASSYAPRRNGVDRATAPVT